MTDRETAVNIPGAARRSVWLGGSALAALSAGLLAAPAVWAQQQGPIQTQAEESATARAGTLEEIVVTSRRYEERVQDAPVSVSVMTPDFLINQKVEDIDEIMALTPGATFTFFNKVNPEASMRGLQTATPGNADQESSVSFMVDDVVIIKDFMRSTPIYDLERVEVLRGPQGTAFGRNASIGAVHFITKRPTREFEVGANGTVGNGELFEADGYISGPITDTLSGRVAFNFDSKDGDTEKVGTGEGIDGQENFAFRGSLLFEPTNRLEVFLKAEYFEDNDEAPVRRSADSSLPQILAADDPRRIDQGGTLGLNMPPFRVTFQDPRDPFQTEISEGNFFFKRQILNLTGHIRWEPIDGITITSITGYVDGQSSGLQDAIGTPENILFQATHNNGESFSQEFHIDNHASGDRFRWLAGFFYAEAEEDRFEENRFFQPSADPDSSEPTGFGGFPFPRVPTRIGVTQKGNLDSIAVFGELSYDVTSRLNLTFGGRWTRDDRDSTISNRGFGFRPIIAGLTGCPGDGPIVCGSPDNPVGFGPVSNHDSWDDFMAKGSIQYNLTDEHMVYFLVSQGFKAGGFQPDPRTAEAATLAFGPERTINFELGFKGEVAGQFRYALTGFFVKLDDTQINQFIRAGDGFFQLQSNAGRVESFGLEGEFTWAPIADFRVSSTFAIQDVELKDTVLNTELGMGGDDFSGTRPDGAAKWTATGFAEYDVHLPWDGSTITLRGDITARSNIFDDIGELPDRARPSLTQLGARATWRSADGHWSFALWGKNLTEDEDIFNIGPNQANTLQPPIQFGNKRTFGATAGFSF